MNATVAQPSIKLPGLINIVLITILGISLAKLMWLVLTPVPKISTQVEQSNQIINTNKLKVNYGKLISNSHLFGKVKKVIVPTKAPPKAVAPTAAVAPTKLNLKLHGIVAYKSKGGFALISTDNGSQKVFSKGEEIVEGKGVRILEILPEKVVLDNNGLKEELILPKKTTPKFPSGLSRKGPRGTFGGGNIDPPRYTNNNSGGKSSVNISRLREEIKNDRRKLMDIAAASPAVVNNQFIGFRIQPGRKRALFKEFGFRPNDIITEVNGIVLDDISKGAVVLGELTEASEVSIKIKRGNREILIQRSF